MTVEAHDNTAHTDRLQGLWVPAKLWTPDNGDEVMALAGTPPDAYDGRRLAKAAPRGFAASVYVPQWVQQNTLFGGAQVRFAKLDDGLGNVHLTLNAKLVNVGGSLTATGSTVSVDTGVTAGLHTQDLTTVVPLPVFNVGGNFLMRLHLSRDGGNPGDTYPGDIVFQGAALLFTADH